MAYVKVAALALFGAAVTMKFLYILVKTVRIMVLKVDPPMAGFDSEPETEALMPEVVVVREAGGQKIPGREAAPAGDCQLADLEMRVEALN